MRGWSVPERELPADTADAGTAEAEETESRPDVTRAEPAVLSGQACLSPVGYWSRPLPEGRRYPRSCAAWGEDLLSRLRTVGVWTRHSFLGSLFCRESLGISLGSLDPGVTGAGWGWRTELSSNPSRPVQEQGRAGSTPYHGHFPG